MTILQYDLVVPPYPLSTIPLPLFKIILTLPTITSRHLPVPCSSERPPSLSSGRRRTPPSGPAAAAAPPSPSPLSGFSGSLAPPSPPPTCQPAPWFDLIVPVKEQWFMNCFEKLVKITTFCSQLNIFKTWNFPYSFLLRPFFGLQQTDTWEILHQLNNYIFTKHYKSCTKHHILRHDLTSSLCFCEISSSNLFSKSLILLSNLDTADLSTELSSKFWIFSCKSDICKLINKSHN